MARAEGEVRGFTTNGHRADGFREQVRGCSLMLNRAECMGGGDLFTWRCTPSDDLLNENGTLVSPHRVERAFQARK
jgi:hypothetical protein